MIYQVLLDLWVEHYGSYPKSRQYSPYALYNLAEKAKHDLSLEGLDEARVDLSYGDEEFCVTLTKNDIEAKLRAEGIVDEIVQGFLDCIQKAGCPPTMRCELIGGNSRLPVIRSTLEAKLQEKQWHCEFSLTLNCDECISNGTALYAAYKIDPSSVGQPELMSCIEELNQTFVPEDGNDFFYRQSEEGTNEAEMCDVVIEKCKECETKLMARHQQALELSSLFNSATGSLIKLKNRLQNTEIPPAIKEQLQQFVKGVNLNQMNFTAEELRCLKGLIDRKINLINQKRDELEVFVLEDGVRRFDHKGVWFDGVMDGNGEYTDYDPANNVAVYYSGNWQNGQMNGQGTYWMSSSREIVKRTGEWRQNELWNGKETSHRSNGITILTAISDGIRGFSYVFNHDDRLVYIGQLKRGVKEGIGMEIYPEEGTVAYIGTFVQGKREGKGSSYDRLGSLQVDGEWRQGHFIKNRNVSQQAQ